MKNTTLYTILTILLIIAGIGVVVYNQLPQYIVGENEIIYSPDWVTLECVPTTFNKVLENNQWEYSDGSFTEFGCDEFTKVCAISYEFDTSLEGKWSDICPFKLTFQKCDASDSCTEFDRWGTHNFGVDVPWINLNAGEYLRVTAADLGGFACLTKSPLNGFTLRKRFDEWGLQVRGDSPLAKYTGNCRITNNFKSGVKDGVLRQDDRLIFDGGEGFSYVSYMNEWNPVESKVIETHPEYGDVYCTGVGYLFKVISEELEDGKTRTLVAGDRIIDGNIECCNQQQGCEDWSWTNEVGECETDANCPGQGASMPYDVGLARIYNCENNECVRELIVTECAVPADCPGGYCDTRSPDANDWSCKSGDKPAVLCGDGICNPLFETNLNCLKDCLDDSDDDSFLWWVVGGVIIFILIIVIIALLFKGKSSSGGTF